MQMGCPDDQMFHHDKMMLSEERRKELKASGVMDNEAEVISSELVPAVYQHHCRHTGPGEPTRSILDESFILSRHT